MGNKRTFNRTNCGIETRFGERRYREISSFNRTNCGIETSSIKYLIRARVHSFNRTNCGIETDYFFRTQR